MTKNEFEKLKSKVTPEGLKLQVQGTSMLPVIESFETITVLPVGAETKFNLFDLLVFWDGNILKCHYFWSKNKIVKTPEGQFLVQTRALNPLSSFDHPVREDQLLGKVDSHKLSLFLKIKVVLHYLLKR